MYDANGKSLELGYGVVDLYAAVVAAKGSTGEPTPPPADGLNLFGTIASPASANQGDTVTVSYTVQLSKIVSNDTTVDVALRFIRPDSNSSTFYMGNVTIPRGETSKTSALIYTLPNNITGVGKFMLAIDTQSVIAETNELDNVASTNITINTSIPVGSNDLEITSTGYTWLDATRVRVGYRVKNVGTATITSYQLGWQFGRNTGVWNRPDTIAPNDSRSFGNVMYTYPGITYPVTFKANVISVNGKPDENANNNSIAIEIKQP